MCIPDGMPVMNGRLMHGAGPWSNNLASLVAAGAGLALVIGGGGCASNRPAPLVIENAVQAAPEPESNQDLSLKLITYNIMGLPSWMTGARSTRYQRIARELERLDPDVILLQEAWTANARKAAPAHGRWSIARAAGQHSFFQQSGLMTLSRFPIIGGQFYPFSRAAFPDRLVNKGVLKATVLLAGGQVLNIWNVHLQDGGSPAVRLSQVRELVARVRAAEDGQIADLVAGDFNCTPDSPLYRELSGALGPSAQELSGKSPFVTWDGLSGKPGAGETLDHIFFRRSAPVQSVRASPHVAFAAARREDRLSDHFGIEADLDLSTAAGLTAATGPDLNHPGALDVVPEHRTYAAGD
jgi:endonuclease/exonuclease/phosphatase family metal-dependent hydrolase